MNVSPDFWPAPIARLAGTYVRAADEYITVAQIADDPVNGFRGMMQLYTTLVPVSEIDDALQATGGIGWKVESWGPHPIVPPEGGWSGAFWVDGPRGSEKRYEALVHGWLNHNRTVMMPDNGFLMCYGLVPRVLGDGRIVWDDPKKPAYDVVEVQPLSLYEVPNRYSRAGVRVLREYLEDYASLKGCAAVAVFFEQRFSFGDADVARALGGSDGVNIELPGRRVSLKRIEPKDFAGADQLVQIWGCRLILKPSGRPVSEEPDPELHWPDSPGPVTPEEARHLIGPLNHVYVIDDVLSEWEKREEFAIYPMSGDVSYDGWWSTSCSYRYGRNHVAVELRKLYEETPPYVIKHFHRYAVPKAEADRDRQQYGERHIGQRAEDVVASFLRMTESLAVLSGRLNMLLSQEDFSGLTTERVRYHGWWTMEELRKLGHVVPITLSQDSFLDRCAQLFQLLERLKRGPLKQILQQLGLKQEDFRALGDNIGALRLLGTICQFSDLAKETGLGLLSDFGALRASWDKDRRVRVMIPLFGLQGLRILRSHPHEAQDREKKFNEALQAFSLDPTEMKRGWGLALDRVYDEVVASLQGVHDLISATTC